jgi:hypothetical protein
VTRKTADRVLREFLDRVRGLIANEDALYQVPEVVIFGSYLTNAERLGDVDLAIEPVQVRMARDDEVLSARPTWQQLRNQSRTLSLIELDCTVSGCPTSRTTSSSPTPRSRPAARRTKKRARNAGAGAKRWQLSSSHLSA